jgi:hypothetical protein
MPNFEALTILPQAMYELLIKPNFSEVVQGTSKVPGALGEFTVMDDVSTRRPIIDIIGNRNIFKRRDASCNIEFTPLLKGSARQIETSEIYGATKNCENEFYKGCLKDFRAKSTVFRDFIMQFFQKAIAVDLDSNAYFGDVSRSDDSTGLWSWNIFDGIFKKYQRYISNGTIPAAQTCNIPSGALTPANAYSYLEWAFNNQNVLLKALPPTMKAFYVSDGIYYGYWQYLQSIGGAFDISLYTNGIQKLSFNGIELKLEPTWSPIMTTLNAGSQADACILTVRGNFLFATDKDYGDGPYLNEAMSVWFSLDERAWKYYMCMKAGTEIALPEHSVIAMNSLA